MAKQDDSLWLDKFASSDQGEIDYLSHDGKTAVEVQRAVASSRGLHSALMQMAMFLGENPAIDRGYLVLDHPRMSLPRIKEEWKKSKQVLVRSVANRLAMIAIDGDENWLTSEDRLAHHIAMAFEYGKSTGATDISSIHDVRQRPGQKFYEIVKVLLVRWLRQEGPIALGKLGEVVGCSYPTIREALERRSLSRLIKSHSNRSIELAFFPHDAWSELVALSNEMRVSFRFRNRAGGKLDPEALLKRLTKQKQLPIAVGGVLAARQWHPAFDLNGTPRLDVLYHAPSGEADLGFVRKLDPALMLDDSTTASPDLVVHALVRKEPLFKQVKEPDLPIADPIETALDLNEMSLGGQADELINHLRPEARLG